MRVKSAGNSVSRFPPGNGDRSPGRAAPAPPDGAGADAGGVALVASSDGRNGSVVIHQDAEIYASILHKKEQVKHAPPAGRKGWLQVVRGIVEVNGQRLRAGDGAALKDEPVLTITGESDGAEILLFDLP